MSVGYSGGHITEGCEPHTGAEKRTGVFGKAASALNYRAISVAPNIPFLKTEAHILLVSSSSGTIKRALVETENSHKKNLTTSLGLWLGW